MAWAVILVTSYTGVVVDTFTDIAFIKVGVVSAVVTVTRLWAMTVVYTILNKTTWVAITSPY